MSARPAQCLSLAVSWLVGELTLIEVSGVRGRIDALNLVLMVKITRLNAFLRVTVSEEGQNVFCFSFEYVKYK